jgi:hypothetical protein
MGAENILCLNLLWPTFAYSGSFYKTLLYKKNKILKEKNNARLHAQGR